jgi:hypothetical protein
MNLRESFLHKKALFLYLQKVRTLD